MVQCSLLPNEALLTSLMIIHLTKTLQMLIVRKSYCIILNWKIKMEIHELSVENMREKRNLTP